MDWARMCQEYGLIGVVKASFITFLGFIIKWILAQFKVELDGARKERTDYLCTLNKISNTIDEHDKRAEERGRYVRDEHKEIIDIAKETLVIAGRINGYKG